MVGLGWDARATDGTDFDLDASAFLLSESGKVRGEHDFIFYNQTRSPEGSVEHTGDNRTGAVMVMMKRFALTSHNTCRCSKNCDYSHHS